VQGHPDLLLLLPVDLQRIAITHCGRGIISSFRAARPANRACRRRGRPSASSARRSPRPASANLRRAVPVDAVQVLHGLAVTRPGVHDRGAVCLTEPENTRQAVSGRRNGPPCSGTPAWSGARRAGRCGGPRRSSGPSLDLPRTVEAAVADDRGGDVVHADPRPGRARQHRQEAPAEDGMRNPLDERPSAGSRPSR